MPQPRDYYDPVQTPLLETVEQYHLTDEVIQGIFRGSLQSSLDDINYVLVHFPNHPRALMYASAIADLARSPTLAVGYFEKAIGLYPQYAETRALYGEYLLHIGQTRASIEMLKSAIRINANHAAAHAFIAQAYAMNGEKELASEEAEKARRYGYKDTIRIDGGQSPTP